MALNEAQVRDGLAAFNRRRRQGGDAELELVEVAQGYLHVRMEHVAVVLNWPTDRDSVWFCSEVSVRTFFG